MNRYHAYIWKEAGASIKAAATSNAEEASHQNKKIKIETKNTAERTRHGLRTG